MQTGSRRRLARTLAGCVALSSLLAACGTHRAKAAAAPPTTTTIADPTTTVAPTTTASTAPPVPTCPLTGLAAPGGQIPQRPALAVKVENFPAARPQYGLSLADVIYEEPVEGGITRFIVIYQCHDSDRVEPVRSGRIVDPEILMQYGAHPLISYSGGIDAAVAAIDSSSLVDVGANRAPVNDFIRDTSRPIPHNLFVQTASLWSWASSQHVAQTPPPAQFPYGAAPTGAPPASSVHISYLYSDLTWTYQAQTGLWARSYSDTGPATQGEGGVVAAANVIVQHVNLYESQYQEDVTGHRENLLTLTGSGPAEIYRNGLVVNGTWNRAGFAGNTAYLDQDGHPVPLAAGPTWIELVPQGVAVTAAP